MMLGMLLFLVEVVDDKFLSWSVTVLESAQLLQDLIDGPAKVYVMGLEVVWLNGFGCDCLVYDWTRF